MDDASRNLWRQNVRNLEQQITEEHGEDEGNKTRTGAIAARVIGTGVLTELSDVSGIERMENLLNMRTTRGTGENTIRGE